MKLNETEKIWNLTKSKMKILWNLKKHEGKKETSGKYFGSLAKLNETCGKNLWNLTENYETLGKTFRKLNKT